jgi:hypothetical protein
MNDELNNPPFDPTPVESFTSGPYYTIKVRSYPETGQNVAAPADPRFEPGFMESLFGPTKATLRRRLDEITENRDLVSQKAAEYFTETFKLRHRNGVLEKQVALVSEVAARRLNEITTLRQNLNAANEEIERLAMAPQPATKRKAPRPKKAK